MGSHAHRPSHTKSPTEFSTGHAHDNEARAAGPGVRPGTRSRILEARERTRADR